MLHLMVLSRREWLRLALVLLLTGLFLALPHLTRARIQTGPAPESDKRHRAHSVPGEILVRFREDAAPAKARRTQLLVDQAGAQIPVDLEQSPGFEIVPGLRIARVAATETQRAIAALRARPDVIYAEPNYIRHKDNVPNDARYGELWGLNNIAQAGGVAGVDIKAEQAWDVTTGSRSVVVAVIDEGVFVQHQDLQTNIWTNPLEVAGNGVDDDGNGFIDDVNGFDFFHNDGSVYDGPGLNPDGSEVDAHGTHVAGTIGAQGNNVNGVVGVNWQVSLMSLKFLGPDGGTSADAVRAYGYVKLMRDRWVSSGGTQGANIRVTNNSYGGGGYSQTEVDAIQAMSNSGVLFVASAGNDADDNNISPSYPATYDLPNVISVAAIDRAGALSSFSNRGSRTVHLAAPGTSVLSTIPGNSYQYYNGTSMASPHVAGTAALLLAAHNDFTVSRLRGAILFSADPSPATNLITPSRQRRLAILRLLLRTSGLFHSVGSLPAMTETQDRRRSMKFDLLMEVVERVFCWRLRDQLLRELLNLLTSMFRFVIAMATLKYAPSTMLVTPQTQPSTFQ
jgi:Subtilase family/Fervidolysin N-terminal prodomain